jgi:hypothetical protein
LFVVGNGYRSHNINNKSGHGKLDERRNTFCNYCKKKGHQESECRKKKREAENPNEEQMNIMVSELACMAFELATDEKDYPTVGSCVNCGRWGPAHVECGYCGEDSGCIYIPDSQVDYNDPTQEPRYSDDEDDDIHDEENSEIGYSDIRDVPEPTYVQKWYPEYNDVRNDGLIGLDLKDLFALVAKHYPLRPEKWDIYINDRVYHMKKFGLFTIPSILKNLDYLSFNTTLHNEYYAQHIKRSQLP